MLKTLQQLNSEPVVLLVKVDTLQGTNKKGYSIDSKNHLTNAEKGTMQRYQIVKKSPDSTSISLKPCKWNHRKNSILLKIMMSDFKNFTHRRGYNKS